MASFSFSNHTLEFVSNFQTLRVKDGSGNTVEDFDLTGDDPVKVGANAANGTWEISVESPSGAIKLHKHDTLGGATLTFSAPAGNARLGGIGLIDLRDISKTGTYQTTYYVDGCPVYLSYHGGIRATHIEFSGTGCYEYAETEE